MFIFDINPRSGDFFFSAPGGDLQTLIDSDLVPLEGDVVHFVRQLVEGLVYLHERNIAHLDIKVSSTHKRLIQTCHVSLVYPDPTARSEISNCFLHACTRQGGNTRKTLGNFTNPSVDPHYRIFYTCHIIPSILYFRTLLNLCLSNCT